MCTLHRRPGCSPRQIEWRLLEREANWLPPWRELLHVYSKLEARGEIRGGRFVAGFAGEQFALPEAIGSLREARRRGDSNALVSLSGADPLNLAGILTPGPKLAGLTRNRVLYRDGISKAATYAFSKRWRPAASGRRAKRCSDPRFRPRSCIYRDTMCGRVTRPTRVHEARWCLM